MKKKLPMAKAVPADKQKGLAAAPVKGASAPEFPTRKDLYRKAGVALGTATLLAGGLAAADAKKPAPPQQAAIATDTVRSIEEGTINGKALAKQQPAIKVYRAGGGIGPAEDMWQIEDVEAYMNWTMAKEGRLAIQTKYKLDLDGTKLVLDGYDPSRNIGYAYVDKNDPERASFSGPIKAKLEQWMKDRKAAILFIEVKRVPDAATLKGKVVKFLHAVAANPPVKK
jgi:hypothetical protein